MLVDGQMFVTTVGLAGSHAATAGLLAHRSADNIERTLSLPSSPSLDLDVSEPAADAVRVITIEVPGDPGSGGGLGDVSQRSDGQNDGMTEASQPSTSDPLGPVDFIVVEFPDGLVTSAGFNELLELSQRGVIKVLDLEFVICDADGARLATPSELDPAPQIDIDISKKPAPHCRSAHRRRVRREEGPDSLALMTGRHTRRTPCCAPRRHTTVTYL